MTRPPSLRPHFPRPSLFGSFADISPRRWGALLCVLCGLAIMLHSWVSRFSINSDGISYLDMADRLLKGDLHVLVHPYWSPLYPCLLALVLRVFAPAPSAEILVVHLLNCFIGLIALASFTFFVGQWSRLRAIDPKDGDSMTARRLRIGFAYALFLWGTIEMIGLGYVTPDLCVAALVYLTAGLCCRLASPRCGWGTSACLGIALGLGYFTKAAMLPLGVALLVLLAIPRLFVWPRRLSLAIAALIFVIMIGPHVFVMSRHQHRLTFGDAGRVNFAWRVLHEVPLHAGWIEYTNGTGIPVHPLRVLGVGPTVLEFKGTVPGTYPLWYDPAFFHEGLRIRFDLRKQVMGLMRSSKGFVLAHGSGLSPLLAGMGVLCAFVFRRQVQVDFSRLWLILWSLAAFGMFAQVTIEARYISPFMVLFWIAVYDAVLPGILASGPLVYRSVIGVTALCIFFSQLLNLGLAADDSLREPRAFAQIVVASELVRLGLRPGEEIATVGYPFSVYYARLARLKVIANIGFRGDGEVYDTGQFWALGDIKFNALNAELRRIGAKAIVSPENCDIAANRGWHSIRDTGYCVQLLD